MLAQSIAFDYRDPAPALGGLPYKAGVFALFAADPKAEPYLSRTTDLRRRISRFLDARPDQTRRLKLAEKVVRIEFTATGSDFESALVLYTASFEAFGERARKRLRLAPASFIRFAGQNPYPRAYVTTKLARGSADHLYGPFPSRVAAEKYLDEALNLFLLRRCTFELHPDPAFPGCVYSEMKMCLAPCYKGCTDERYTKEAAQVQAFFATRGADLLEALAQARDAASTAMEFETAAAIHARVKKVEGVAALAAEVIRPLSQLRATLVMPSAEPFHVALFSLEGGSISGPALYSVAGIRHPNEHSGSSSLFAHPLALQPVPLVEAVPPGERKEAPEEHSPGSAEHAPAASTLPFVGGVERASVALNRGDAAESRGLLESRLEQAFAKLEAVTPLAPTQQTISDQLCIFKRWYYRPAAHRIGEIVFHKPASAPPVKPILRAISRVFRGASFAAESESGPLTPAPN